MKRIGWLLILAGIFLGFLLFGCDDRRDERPKPRPPIHRCKKC